MNINITKDLTLEAEHYGDLSRLFHRCRVCTEKNVVFNFSQSDGFDHCLSICICYMIEQLINRGINVDCKFKEEVLRINSIDKAEFFFKRFTDIITMYILKDISESKQIQWFQDELTNLELSKDIISVIYEIVMNTSMHSDNKAVYIAISESDGFLKIVLYNPGQNISDNVKRAGYEFEEDNADLGSILWAIKRGNSTRQNVAGGLGLFISRESVVKKGGTITIISGKGCVIDEWEIFKNWEEESIPNITTVLPREIKGTLIAITVPNTHINDETTYCIEEISIGELIRRF